MKKNIEDTLYWMALHDVSIFQILIGFMIVMAGLVITYYFGRSADYHCVRAGEKQIRCDITQKLLGFLPLGVHRVNHIQMAELEEHMDSDYHATYRVVFVTSDGRVSLTNYTSSDYAPKADLVHQVNNFINSDQQSSPGCSSQNRLVDMALLFRLYRPGGGDDPGILKKYLSR